MSESGTKRPSSLPFIPAKLDDYGLPATVFRTYCHIARRAGENGECYAAVPAMAEVVKIHPQTIRTALKLLVNLGMLTEERRAGQTSIYRLSPVSKWQPYRNGYPTETDTLPKRIQGYCFR